MSLTTATRPSMPDTLPALQELVAEGAAFGPFEGRGAIERSLGYRMLLRGFAEGRHVVDPHPEDADAFMRGADGTVCFWLLRHERRRCVVRRCAMSHEWIVIRMSDIHHTRMAREFRSASSAWRASSWQRTSMAGAGGMATVLEVAQHAMPGTGLSGARQARRRGQHDAWPKDVEERARARLRAHSARYADVIEHLDKTGGGEDAALAQRLGITGATLAVLKHRARKRLHAFLQEELRSARSEEPGLPALQAGPTAGASEAPASRPKAGATEASELQDAIANELRTFRDVLLARRRPHPGPSHEHLSTDASLNEAWQSMAAKFLGGAARRGIPLDVVFLKHLAKWPELPSHAHRDAAEARDIAATGAPPKLAPSAPSHLVNDESWLAVLHRLAAQPGLDASAAAWQGWMNAVRAPESRRASTAWTMGGRGAQGPRAMPGLERPAVTNAPEPMRAMALPRRGPRHPMLLVAFDSAWTATGQGCLTIVDVGQDEVSVVMEPQLVGFEAALERLSSIAGATKGEAQVVIAIDQPIVVPNASGRRPVDAVASCIAARVQSATQPANRARTGMFDDEAPVWKFLAALRERWPDLSLDPADVREGGPSAVVVEVYPVLGLLGLLPGLLERGELFRYNPARPTFRVEGWATLCVSLSGALEQVGVPALSSYCQALARLPFPTKRDHDRLESLICAALGLFWASGAPMGVLGDLERGYMLFPASEPLLSAVRDAARTQGVPVRHQA